MRIGNRPTSRQRRGASSGASRLLLLFGWHSLPSSASSSALSLPPTCICDGVHTNFSKAPAACRRQKMASHKSLCPTSCDFTLQPWRCHLGDHCVIPL